MHLTRLATLLTVVSTALSAGIAAPAVAAPPPPAPYAYTVAQLPIPEESYPSAIALDYEYDTLYVLDADYDTLYLVDPTSGAVQSSFPGIEGNSLALDTAAHVVYSYSPNTGEVTAVARDGSTRSVDGMGAGARDIAVDPRTHELYGLDLAGDSVRVVAATGGRVATLSVGDGPVGIAVDDVARRAYVSNILADTVSVIDLDTHVVTTTIPAGQFPADVAVDQVTHRAYVSNAGDNTVSVIDGSTDRVIGAIPLPDLDGGIDIAVDQVTHTAYGATGYSSVLVMDLTSDTVTATIPTSQEANTVVVDPVRHAALVLEGRDDDIVLQRISQLVMQRAVVRELSATTGGTSGGEQITITGDHFAGASKVTFGGAKATAFTVESDNRIVATVPPHAAGKVAVRVKTTGLSAKSRYSRYTYLTAAG